MPPTFPTRAPGAAAACLRRVLLVPAAACLLAALASASEAACAAPVSGDGSPRAVDCLFVLRAGVDLEPCPLCLCDADGNELLAASDALLCLRWVVGQPVALSCPDCPVTTTSTSTTTIPVGDGCPDVVELATHAGYGNMCSSNADCELGDCDNASGRCHTATRYDVGWTGLSHGHDLHEGSALRLRVQCDATRAPCGECRILGVDPSAGGCRCENDLAVFCDEPGRPDGDDCGGGECVCFASPPLPTTSLGFPLCELPRIESVSGTIDVDSGTVVLDQSLRRRIYLGILTTSPCPVCGGTCAGDAARECTVDDDCDAAAPCVTDAVAGDGVREGTCVRGGRDGLPCDVGAVHAGLPARGFAAGGAGYSLDCPPDVGKNISGAGLVVRPRETTGPSELAARLSCQGVHPERSCPCLQCSGNPAVPCNTNEECAAFAGTCSLAGSQACAANSDCTGVSVGPCVPIGPQRRCQKRLTELCSVNADCDGQDVGPCEPSTCSAAGITSVNPLPNDCIGMECTDLGDGAGQCTNGPDEKFCDGVALASGAPVFACTSNDDCFPSAIGIDGGGNCSITRRRRCFPDPIAADGQADPQSPLLAATFCQGPTSGTGTNTVIGLPGPVRLERQVTLRTFCPAPPEQEYVPGSGGCPP